MGTTQCAGKLAGYRLLDWSFHALILVFPVIWYFLFGSWFKSQLGSLVSDAKGLCLDIIWNWKNCHNGDQYFPVWNMFLMFVIPISRGIVALIWIFFGFGKIATIRRRGAHIANVVPGPRPRTGFGGGDVEHCLLLWWYAVSTDQATKLHVWYLIFHCQCIGKGKRRRLVCPRRHVGIEAFYPSWFLCG